MAIGQWAVVYRQVQKLFDGGSVTGLTEGQLLDRFLGSRDEIAFGAIVARHGPMVLGVCRGVLADPQDVEDAFQVTFLLLVKKAHGLRDRDRLGPWLYGVARRVSLRARANASKRSQRELTQRPEPSAPQNLELRELQSVIREEVDRLSSRDRMAVVYCYLEGLTHEEAAERLGWPLGTVKGRLARARETLKDRLTRRGVALPTVLGPNLGPGFSSQVPISLMKTTVVAATRLAAGQTLTTSLLSASVITLMEGMMKTMFTTPLKIAASVLVAGSVLAAPSVLIYQKAKTPPVPDLNPSVAPAPVGANAPKQDVSPPVVTKASDLRAAREVSAEFAEQALQALDEIKLNGGAVSPADYASWSRRLIEAVSDPVITRDVRLKLLRAHLKRVEAIYEQDQRNQVGSKSKLAGLESAYLLNEAYRLVQEAEAKPIVAEVTKAPKVIPDGGGGAIDPPPPQFPLALKPNPLDDKRNEDIMAKLELPIAMKFAEPTALEDVLKFIKEATQDKNMGFPSGIPIYVDPRALEIAETEMNATVVIDVEGIPLRTNLRLLLHQLRLNYRVEGGLLLIIEEKPSDAFPLRQPGGMGGGIGGFR